MRIQKRWIHQSLFMVSVGIYLILINIVGWYSDEYEDILLYTTLGIFTVLLIKRTSELQRLQEQQKQLMLDISHSLQTPLAVFQNKLDLLKTTAPDDTTICMFENSLRELSVFISDLLRLARLEHSSINELVLTPFDLSAETEELLDEIRIIAADRSVHVEADIVPGIYIRGNSAKIRGIILGLASNSIKYMRTVRTGLITFSLYTEPGWVVLSVKDNGIGIAAHDLPHIFDRFWRAQGVEHAPGSGLGLALAKHIVERHGGTLTAASELGVGTTLTVRIPCIS